MYEGIIQDLIDELGRLPGVGPKSAQRIAFHIIASDRIDVARLAEVLKTVKERVKFCTTCGNISEEDLCKICRDPRRDNTSICVVEESKDVIAIEKTREFKGKYHVLGGAISPIDGIGPENLRIKELMSTGMYEGAIQDLIDALGRLPGIGPKSAQRIAFHILQSDGDAALALVDAIRTVKERVRFCDQCGNVSEETECRICRDPRRDPSQICVVEESKDVIAIERTREFRGKYHVLGGAISPIDGIGPDQLRIRELMVRLSDSNITEVILATDPNLEGEATATYLARLIKPLGIKTSRLASGLPVGGDLEYADEVTLGRAFEGRRNVEG